MEWTPPPDAIAMRQGFGALNHLKEQPSAKQASIAGIV